MSATPVTVCLFLRPIVPGAVKTRLIPALGAAGAAGLYAAFVRDSLARWARPDVALQLWVAGDPDHPSLAALPQPRFAQPETDLGTRMAAALAAAPPDRPALCVGTDVPALPATTVDAALAALRSPAPADLVLVPAADGGYALIGRSGPRLPPLERGIRYSTRHALADTLAAARGAGLSAVLLPPTYDVDTPAGLRLLALHLSLDPGVAPATARAIIGGRPF